MGGLSLFFLICGSVVFSALLLHSHCHSKAPRGYSHSVCPESQLQDSAALTPFGGKGGGREGRLHTHICSYTV